MFEDPKEELLKSLLPDGDRYTVILAMSDAETEECERKGYHFIGRGLHGDSRFCAYLKLNPAYR